MSFPWVFGSWFPDKLFLQLLVPCSCILLARAHPVTLLLSQTQIAAVHRFSGNIIAELLNTPRCTCMPPLNGYNLTHPYRFYLEQAFISVWNCSFTFHPGEPRRHHQHAHLSLSLVLLLLCWIIAVLFIRPDIINPLKVQVEQSTQSAAFASLLFLFWCRCCGLWACVWSWRCW